MQANHNSVKLRVVATEQLESDEPESSNDEANPDELDSSTDDPNGSDGAEMWTELRFGCHKGKTLPQVLMTDPDWFWWAVRDDILKYQPAVEAKILCQRISRIRIPKPDPENWEVEYQFDENNRFQGFSIVQVGSYMHYGSDDRYRERHLDLGCVRRPFDKKGGKNLIRDFRSYYFDDQYLTKRRIEAFFDDEANFAV